MCRTQPLLRMRSRRQQPRVQQSLTEQHLLLVL
jgi:hypothetical protein